MLINDCFYCLIYCNLYEYELHVFINDEHVFFVLSLIDILKSKICLEYMSMHIYVNHV